MARQWGDDETDVHAAVLGVTPDEVRGRGAGSVRRPPDPIKWSALAGWSTAGVLAAALLVSWAGQPRRVDVPVLLTPSPRTVTAEATVTRFVPAPQRAVPFRVEPRFVPRAVPSRTSFPAPSTRSTAVPERRPEPTPTPEPTPSRVPSPAPQTSAPATTPPVPSLEPTAEPVEETPTVG